MTLSAKPSSVMRPKPICEICAASENGKLSSVSQYEMDKLCTMDEYPSDSVVFTAFGCDLHIQGELVADAFASMPEREQSILILYCVLGLTDGEIGRIAEISRSAVQRHRTKALNELRKDLQSKGVRH